MASMWRRAGRVRGEKRRVGGRRLLTAVTGPFVVRPGREPRSLRTPPARLSLPNREPAPAPIRLPHSDVAACAWRWLPNGFPFVALRSHTRPPLRCALPVRPSPRPTAGQQCQSRQRVADSCRSPDRDAIPEAVTVPAACPPLTQVRHPIFATHGYSGFSLPPAARIILATSLLYTQLVLRRAHCRYRATDRPYTVQKRRACLCVPVPSRGPFE